MTLAEIDDTVALMRAAGRSTIPVCLTVWREMMAATKISGTVKDGKLQPKRQAPHFAQAKKAKADRVEKGLRKNREAKR